MGASLVLFLSACQEPTGARASIGPEGGQLSSEDEVLTLVIHPGALSKTIEVEIAPSDVPPRSSGRAYSVRPFAELRVLAEVVYRHDERLSERAVVAAIRRADLDAGRGHWIPLSPLQHDAEHGLAAGVDDELSPYYGLIDADLGTDTDTGTGTGSESGTGTDSGSSSSGETGFGVLSYAADIQPIWDENCLGSGCHSSMEDGGSPLAAVDLSGNAYDRLVDASPVSATVPYVSPGDPARSYLLHKLEGTHLEECDCNGSGTTMPLGRPLLPEETRAMIRAWIEQGAPE